MKDGLRQIVGKHIVAVAVAENAREPTQQLFLVFSDGTSFELWGSSFSCCAGLDEAAAIEHGLESSGARITRVFGNAADHGSLENLLTRDLDAWRAAKAAIERARSAK